MSYYGQKTFTGIFSCSKMLLQAGSSYRFGGTHAQIAYAVADGSAVDVTLHHSGVNVIDAVADTVSVALVGIKLDTPATFSDLTFVDVADAYTLAGDKYAILLDGSLTLDGNILDGSADLHLLQPGAVVSGTGKLLVFSFTQA